MYALTQENQSHRMPMVIKQNPVDALQKEEILLYITWNWFLSSLKI